MQITSTFQSLAATLLIFTLTACGGGSGGDDEVVPTGSTLTNVWFADNEGYFPLDKLTPSGAFYKGTEPDFGALNPAYTASTKTNSRWAIDASATVTSGKQLTYDMAVEPVNASATEADNLRKNLNINSNTGLITQFCSGFPVCYANLTASEQTFLITVTARVVGGKGELVRSFIFRVR